jgi:hypothetical protein
MFFCSLLLLWAVPNRRMHLSGSHSSRRKTNEIMGGAQWVVVDPEISLGPIFASHPR